MKIISYTNPDYSYAYDRFNTTLSIYDVNNTLISVVDEVQLQMAENGIESFGEFAEYAIEEYLRQSQCKCEELLAWAYAYELA